MKVEEVREESRERKEEEVEGRGEGGFLNAVLES